MTRELIDVSRCLVEGFPAWPGDPPYSRVVESCRAGERTVRYSRLTLGAHSGTHVDAPAHLPSPDGPARGVDELDLAVLLGPARVVDARGCGATIPARLIHALPPGPPRVLLRTDNSARPYAMMGFVALAPEAAEALVTRACLLVGIDGPSLDPAEADDLPAHRALLDAGVTVIEGLDLARAAPGDYELLCLPLALAGADGAPARVVLRTLR